MRVHFLTFITLCTTSFLMSACSPINSEFSCNATAGDSCMTIEQVDAMTRYADGEGTNGNLSTHQRGARYGSRVWVSQHS